jgi:hypothetical protein
MPLSRDELEQATIELGLGGYLGEILELAQPCLRLVPRKVKKRAYLVFVREAEPKG